MTSKTPVRFAEDIELSMPEIGDSEKQGQFGDQFGAVNALFSGLAFAGLIFTIILQKKEA